MRWIRLATFCVSTLLLGVGYSAAADLESAKRAYENKEYLAAANEFLVLAEQGSEEAQLAIGRMYMVGQGVQRDRAQAIKWLTVAASQGNATAQFFLGALYLLPQTDVSGGLRWLLRSAEQGMQDAQYLVGKAYMQGGDQLPRDPVRGLMWLHLAAHENQPFYQNELRATEGQMTVDQIARAKALAAEWKAVRESDAHSKP